MKRTMTALILAGLLAAGSGSGQQKDQLEVELQSAIRKERVEGDLKGAIEQYRKISQSANRALAARALVRMGQCYEKMGNEEARRAYERTIRDFGDQKDAVATARLRLVAMRAPDSTPRGEARARLIWDNATDLWGTASADGRYLSFVDWSTGDLAIRDLQAGQNRKVTDRGGYANVQGESEANAISPDGKRIAFAWLRFKGSRNEGFYQLRLIDADGKGERTLYPANGWTGYMEAHSWSPDGKWIAVAWEDPAVSGPGDGNGTEIILVSPDDGRARVLPTRSKLWKRKITFSPDSKWLAYDSDTVRNSGKSSLFLLPADGSAKGETELAADARMMGWTPDGNGVLFRRVRNGMNGLHLQPVSQGKAAGEAQQIRTASVVGDISLGVTPQGTLLHGSHNRQADAWISEIDTKTGQLNNPVFRTEAVLVGLGGVGGNVKFSPDGTRWMCTVPINSILIRSMVGKTEQIITPQMLQIRRIEWSGDGCSILISGLGRDGKTGLYRTDPDNGATAFLAPITPGWVFAPARDGRTIYHKNPKGVMAYNLDDGKERLLFGKELDGPMELRVSHDGKRLAVRGGGYLGIVDLASGELKQIYQRAEESMGMTFGHDWSGDDRLLVTIVRTDASGRGNNEVWIFPVDGGEPVKQAAPGNFGGLSISPDGKYAGTLRIEARTQIWALENFLPARAQQK